MINPNKIWGPEGPQQNGGRLGIFQLVNTSLQSLWLCRDDAIRLAVIPALLYFAGMAYGQSAAFALMTAIESGTATINPGIAGRLMLTGIIALVSLVLLAVNWLRFLLLGREAAPGIGLALGRQHFLFFFGAAALGLASLFALTLVSLPIQLLLRGAAPYGMWIAALAITAIIIRLGLALVAVAIGQPVGLRQAWAASRGQSLVLLVAFLLTEIPFMLLVTVIGLIAGLTGLSAIAPYTLLFIGCLIQMAAVMAQCGVLAAAYRRLIGVRA